MLYIEINSLDNGPLYSAWKYRDSFDLYGYRTILGKE